MFYKREGYPDEGEVVLCTVTKVQPHSVFVRLDEFDKGGMIHISEVSPGRIRNIRDFVVEDKVIVCQVLRVNKDRGYIDLSLRRVNDNLKRKKIEVIKQEQKAEKIVEALAKEVQKQPLAVYKEIFTPISAHYTHLSQCFQEVSTGEITLEEVGVPSIYIKQLKEIIGQRIKPKEVYVGGKLMIQSYLPDGVEVIKQVLLAGIAKGKDMLTMTYLGAGVFNVLIKGEEYKEAEHILDSVLTTIQTELGKKGTYGFTREEKKATVA
ncbi:MAG: S1 RNA-binding domain-containing protein [Candidatus Woesearchaeota archaeon]|jgi:translation initiation factor 2 subunit 1